MNAAEYMAKRQELRPTRLEQRNGEMVMVITLTRGYEAIVDANSDAGRWNWRVHLPKIGTPYAARSERASGKLRTIYLHAYVMDTPKGAPYPDHRNHDGLDNRMSNLRPATMSQNMAHARFPLGASGYRGVYLKRTRRDGSQAWVAQLGRRRSGKYLGIFDSAQLAASAYDAAASVAYGEFAILNFPEPPHG